LNGYRGGYRNFERVKKIDIGPKKIFVHLPPKNPYSQKHLKTRGNSGDLKSNYLFLVMCYFLPHLPDPIALIYSFLKPDGGGAVHVLCKSLNVVEA
jgi:hypothetical protein